MQARQLYNTPTRCSRFQEAPTRKRESTPRSSKLCFTASLMVSRDSAIVTGLQTVYCPCNLRQVSATFLG